MFWFDKAAHTIPCCLANWFHVLSENRERGLCRQHPSAGVRNTPSVWGYFVVISIVLLGMKPNKQAYPFGIDDDPCAFQSTLLFPLILLAPSAGTL